MFNGTEDSGGNENTSQLSYYVTTLNGAQTGMFGEAWINHLIALKLLKVKTPKAHNIVCFSWRFKLLLISYRHTVLRIQ